MIDDLRSLVADWPVPRVAAVVIAGGDAVGSAGDLGWTTRLASISKPLAAYAGLVALEEETISLDQPAGREGATIRHLLAHAAGYAFDSDEVIAGVGQRRIYSNTGIEMFAEALAAAAGIPFVEYLHEAVFRPLGMDSARLRGSPAHGVESSVQDLTAFAVELLDPTLIGASTLAEATSIQFPALPGVVPGVGRFDPNPWGLGFEIKGDKHGHWMGTQVSRRTYGHFGGAGTFLWVDPDRSLAAIVLTDREFGTWAMDVWPGFSDEVVRRYGAGRSGQ
jgi:CubicO group peptidase (beta-lactamase class C family)